MIVRMKQRYLVLMVGALLVMTACGARPVNPDAVVAQRQAEAQKVVHDFTIVVTTGNKEGKIPDNVAIALLRIDQQVSDVIHDNPQGWQATISTVAKNAQEALPPDLQAKLKVFIDSLIAKLGEVR